MSKPSMFLSLLQALFTRPSSNLKPLKMYLRKKMRHKSSKIIKQSQTTSKIQLRK